MTKNLYSERYFKQFETIAYLSAKEIIPLVLELVKPKSVTDVGCGTGTWLSIFKEMGTTDLLGIDGGYLDQKMLQIPLKQFLAHDLKKPININRQFDLVVSLEVAEHLSQDCAQDFIDSLVRLGPVVLFSAAIPHQGGVGHLNEQWPKYWADLFRKYNYAVVDCLRERIWDNPKIGWWYAQNILFYVQKEKINNYPFLKQDFRTEKSAPSALVHPRCYLAMADKYPPTMRMFVKKLLQWRKWI